jgi:hypothetical protein
MIIKSTKIPDKVEFIALDNSLFGCGRPSRKSYGISSLTFVLEVVNHKTGNIDSIHSTIIGKSRYGVKYGLI